MSAKSESKSLPQILDVAKELAASVDTLVEQGMKIDVFAVELLAFIVEVIRQGENGILHSLQIPEQAGKGKAAKPLVRSSTIAKMKFSVEQAKQHCMEHLRTFRGDFGTVVQYLFSSDVQNEKDRAELAKAVWHLVGRGIVWVRSHEKVILPGTTNNTMHSLVQNYWNVKYGDHSKDGTVFDRINFLAEQVQKINQVYEVALQMKAVEKATQNATKVLQRSNAIHGQAAVVGGEEKTSETPEKDKANSKKKKKPESKPTPETPEEDKAKSKKKQKVGSETEAKTEAEPKAKTEEDAPLKKKKKKVAESAEEAEDKDKVKSKEKKRKAEDDGSTSKKASKKSKKPKTQIAQELKKAWAQFKVNGKATQLNSVMVESFCEFVETGALPGNKSSKAYKVLRPLADSLNARGDEMSLVQKVRKIITSLYVLDLKKPVTEEKADALASAFDDMIMCGNSFGTVESAKPAKPADDENDEDDEGEAESSDGEEDEEEGKQDDGSEAEESD